MIETCLTKNCFGVPAKGSNYCTACGNVKNLSAASRPEALDATRAIMATVKPPAPPNDQSDGRRVADKREGENSGGDVDYYRVFIEEPKRPDVVPYMAECEDIIEHLGMDFAEGSAFKSIWRKAAQRTHGHLKRGNDAHGLRDSEKVEYYGKRQVAIAKRRAKKPTPNVK